ncbi:MAG: type IV secretory system conjugative DNA transfer family protein [Bacilli bacterium]|nr:type IV secretory system conjugative DNA transfer family protein [Bacilli bacterium]
MSVALIIILLILILVIFVFIYIEPLFMKHKVKSDNEYGSARFSKVNEIKKNFKKEKVNNIREAGFPVFYSRNLKDIYFDRITPHYVYLGSTGSGKSVTAVIPTCTFISKAKIKRSVFITDPKGEIYQTTSNMFEKRGYNVLTIDFRNPELSNKINILEPIIIEYENYILKEEEANNTTDEKKKILFLNESMNHYAETNRLITSLSTMVMQEKYEQKDPFWNESAKNLLEGIIGFFLEEYKEKKISREKITMTSIKKFQNSSMEEKNFKNFKDYINQKPYGSKSKDALVSILSASENTYKSITAVFGQKMNIFDDVNVANVTSSSDFDFNILGKEPTALYVVVPDEDKTYYTLVTIIVGLLYRELVKLASKEEKKNLPLEIDFILDEFANCPPLSDIESIVSVARSRGMHFHFFIQSFSQLDNVYGKDVSQIILDNCGLVYLKTNTQETAEIISKRLGKQTIESNSVRQSVSLTNYNGDRSTNLMGRDLMTPDEVKQLHYKTIIFPIVGFPIFRKTILYNKFSSYISGEVARKIKHLKDLSNTYFVVEDINYKTNNNVNKNSSIAKEFYENMELVDKENLKPLEVIISKIFKSNYELKYKTTPNHRIYLSVVLNRKITSTEKGLLIAKIPMNKYYYNLVEKNKKICIEIHNEVFNLKNEKTSFKS